MGMLEIFRISGRIACEYSDAQRGIEAVSRSADSTAESIEDLGETSEDTGESVEGLGDETEKTGNKTEKAKDKTKGFSTALSSLGTVAGKVAKVMSAVAKGVGLAMTAVAGGVVIAGKAATSVGMEFESAVSQLAATMGTSVDNITELSEKAKKMGAETQFSATQAAEGLNILAMSGLEAEEQIQIEFEKLRQICKELVCSIRSTASCCVILQQVCELLR